jgi:hypothetical protein
MGPRARDGRWRRPTRGAAGTVPRPQTAGGWADRAPSAGNGSHLGAAVAPLMRRLYGIGRQPPGDESSESSGDDLRGMFVHLKEKFGAAPLDWYLDNLPRSWLKS